MSSNTLKRPHEEIDTTPSKKQNSKREVKFLIISDTHDHNAELSSYPACDVVLHCGDITEDGSPSSISNALQALGKIDAELRLLIAGNHEISLDKEYYISEGGSEAEHDKSVALVKGPDSEASKNGITYLEEGTHEFTLKSGATFRIYASQWTPKYGASAFQYPTNEDRYNPASPEWAKNVGTEKSIIPHGVGIVMTHGPPQYILDSTADGRSAGCEHLRRAIARVRPKLHCFGHVHKGYGAQRVEYSGGEADPIVPLSKEWVGQNQAKKKGYASIPPGSVDQWRSKEQTLMINAAIEDEHGEPGNMPWMVSLELPVEDKKT